MTAPLMEVALAGAVDGLTESLPLSGAAHRALARMLLSVEPDATRGQLTALGVWTAAAMFFRKGVLATSFEAARGVLYPTLLRETRAGRAPASSGVLALPRTARIRDDGLGLRPPLKRRRPPRTTTIR